MKRILYYFLIIVNIILLIITLYLTKTTVNEINIVPVKNKAMLNIQISEVQNSDNISTVKEIAIRNINTKYDNYLRTSDIFSRCKNFFIIELIIIVINLIFILYLRNKIHLHITT